VRVRRSRAVSRVCHANLHNLSLAVSRCRFLASLYERNYERLKPLNFRPSHADSREMGRRVTRSHYVLSLFFSRKAKRTRAPYQELLFESEPSPRWCRITGRYLYITSDHDATDALLTSEVLPKGLGAFVRLEMESQPSQTAHRKY